MTKQVGFWFVDARRERQVVHLAVGAFTERSARMQARKRLGPHFTIERIGPLQYAHGWILNMNWRADEAPHE